MSISSVSGLPGALPVTQGTSATRTAAPTPGTAPDRPNFGERIGAALDGVADAQARASQAAKDFEAGRTEDLAAVMVEQQVSSLGFQLTMQVRNKALTAYRDIMNMPV